jgi:hypothetical protein
MASFFLEAYIMDPGVPVRALLHELENPHLTFPETVQKQRNPVLYENTSHLHAPGVAPPCEGNQSGQGKRSCDLRNLKKHYHLMQIFDKIKPIGIFGHIPLFFQKMKP